MEEQSLQIRRFEKIPTAEEFTSQIERKNVPAVFVGCVENWKAFSDWNPANGGLDYLQGRVGSSVVEAMLSRYGPMFYGDIRSHERVPLPFSIFIGYCKEVYQNGGNHLDASFRPEKHVKSDESGQSFLASNDDHKQIYLAQVPIMNTENEEKVQLPSLREDIQLPTFLEAKSLASINLWMSSSRARSSTHYDPHHNILCVISGRKQVVLWPPSASPSLYPMPLHGEASNHSAIALEHVDLSVHPRAECAMEISQKVTIQAGDALFIPEGWFHQVDSDCLTIAVNFWWRSEVMSGMSEHMDAYYMRRILKRLTEKEMNQVLFKASNDAVTHTVGHSDTRKTDNDELNLDANSSGNLKAKKLKERASLHELEPLAIQSLHELVSLVHDRVSIADRSQSADSSSTSGTAVGEKGEGKLNIKVDGYHLEDDPVANIFCKLEPLTLQSVFLAMAQNFPRTLEALILHLLSPVGAEVLTRRFDEMDQLMVEEERNEFYQIFYGVFDDQFAVMDAILNAKETYALQYTTGHIFVWPQGDSSLLFTLKFSNTCKLKYAPGHGYIRETMHLLDHGSELLFLDICCPKAFKNVLEKYLGIKFAGSQLWVG